MGLVGLTRAYDGGLLGILSGLTKSTDHPSKALRTDISRSLGPKTILCRVFGRFEP